MKATSEPLRANNLPDVKDILSCCYRIMAVISQTSEYALRAATVLAEREAEGPVDVALLAKALAVPRNYLSKTLSQLSRSGVLESVRGKNGGFMLARPGREITLYQVVEPFERFDVTRRCLLGQSVCSDRTACSAHAAWRSIGDRIVRFLRRTTLADLATGRTAWPGRVARRRRPVGRLADL